MKAKVFLLVLIALLPLSQLNAQAVNPKGKTYKFMSYNKLVMAGYQGWFNAEGDGAGRGWYHYAKKNNVFEPGSCKVDYWPDVSEYEKKYKTSFVLANGQPAYVFSSYDESTVDLHFKWMKDYGIDGAFLQRFITTLKDPKGKLHYKKVLIQH